MKFVSLNMVVRGDFDEDTDTYGEASQVVVINASNVRCFYARKLDRPGTRITFADGGGFAVTEGLVDVARLVADLDVATMPRLAAPTA